MTNLPVRKSTLMRSCAGAALLASLTFGAMEAAAQGINATPAVEQGSAQFDNMVPGTTRVTIDTQDTVIDWRPFLDNNGDALTYLPQGNIAIFQNGTNNTNFAVLNRIIPDAANNPALFEGLVQSFLFDALGNQAPGGFVAFYSPSGIIVGPTGRFEVPQLMLTTQAVDIATINNFVTGNLGGQIFLTGNTGSIDLQGGSTFVGAPEDSFFVVASPQINMAGDAFYNGSIAYVASTSVLMSHSSGLFDIIITGGAGGGQVITHTGSSGGPSSTGAGDEHVIYGVTQGAIGGAGVSMLFSGNLGFQPAAGATVVNGDIILSANYSVFGRNVDGSDNRQGADSFFDGRNQVPGVPGEILLFNIDATSNFLAIASDNVVLDANESASTFASDLSLVGRQQAIIDADNGGFVSVGGDLFVSARNFGLITQSITGVDAAGGFASVRSGTSALIEVTGETMVAASAIAGFDFITNTAGSATGGQAQILAEAGTINLLGNVRMESYARYLPQSLPPSGYGAMQGGQVQFLATGGGSLGTPGTLDIDAEAEAPSFSAADAALAGNVNGGNVVVGVGTNGGDVSVAGNVTASANADVLTQDFATGTGPVAIGGSVNFSVIDAGQLDFGGDVSGSAIAAIAEVTGGGSTGSASGGSAGVSATDGDIAIVGSLSLEASGQGGDGGAGGDALGGDASLQTNNGAVSVGGTTALVASGSSGNATGAGDGGAATGGAITISVQTGGTASLGLLGADSSAVGGNGFDGSSGGNALGGTIDITVDGVGSGLTTSDNINLTTRADGGDTTAAGIEGGAANGGGISVAISGSGSLDVGGQLDGITSALGGSGPQGGDATGGTASIAITGSTATIGADVTLQADAGSGFDPTGIGAGGFAQGGSVGLLIDNSVFTAASGALDADAIAGGSAGAGTGGSATGGTTLVDITNGSTVDLGLDFGLFALAVSGGSVGGDGGEGIGGDNRLLVSGGSDVTVTRLTYETTVTGNNGATGGNATGGSNLLQITGSTFDTTRLTIFGAVVTRPDNAVGTGGSAIIRLSDGSIATFGETYLEAYADAIGADASSNSGTIIVETLDGGSPSIATFGNAEFFNDALGGATNTAGVIQVNGGNGDIEFIDLLIGNGGNVANANLSQITADGGTVRIADFLTFSSFGDILLSYANGGAMLGGTAPTNLTASFDITAIQGGITVDGDSTADRSIAALGLNLTSDFITVGTDARFGGTDIVLTSTNTGEQAVIGGATPSGGYSLLADEAAAIDGTTLTIILPDIVGTPVDALLDDVTFLGSGSQRFNTINLFVEGSLDIVGAVNFTSLLSGDTLNIAVEQAIQLALPTGSITLDDGSSGIAGDLLISGTSFAAADPALLAIIAADPLDMTIADALLDDGGATTGSTYISADRVEMTGIAYIFGQNTGANGVYGGITVGAGGLLITQAQDSPDPMNVIAFGLRDDGTGRLTNDDFFFVVEFAADLAASYLADATFNNCIIVTQTCPTTPVEPEGPDIDVPITNQILVEQPVRPKQNIEEGAMTDSQFGFDFPSLLDAPLISEDEVIRDPVTSGIDSAVGALVGTAAIREQEDDEEEEE